MKDFDIQYWVQIYAELKTKPDFLHSDELREMIRRMGYVLSNSFTDIKAKKV